MRIGSVALVASAALVAAGGLYLLVAVRQGSPALDLEAALAAHATTPAATPAALAPAPPPAPSPPRLATTPPPAPAAAAPAPPPPPAPPAPAPTPPAMVTTASGLQYQDVQRGTGATPTVGQTCVVHYTGWLWVDGAKGAQVDSSRDRSEPLKFACGSGQVIKGWDEGVGSMRVGGLRTLLIPANLGYGEGGAGSAIPPHSTLRFEIELVALE